MIKRNRAGALCGYVVLESGHRYYGMSYDNINKDIDVHGGLTFSEFAIATAGSGNRVYVIGFDCAHYTDYVPAFHNLNNIFFSSDNIFPPAVYRNMDYVTQELKRLVEQLK